MRLALRERFNLHRYRQGSKSLAVSIMLAIFGVGSISYSLLGQQEPPRPSLHAAVPREPIRKPQLTLARSEPVHLQIPDIAVASPLIQTGLMPDGSPAVPEGEDVDTASWMNTSATPGEIGTAVLLGHVDSYRSGPSVFFDLGKLQPGQEVHIGRQDGRVAIFKIDRVQAFDRANFPSDEIYGHADYPALRLITCGGDWIQDIQQYSQNVVAFASLARVE